MRNFKLTIEYDGTNYAGWQIQKARKTIQETIEKTLRKILQEKIKLIVSGRTDAGVHAFSQVANFKTDRKIPVRKLQWALNGLLPDDIVITRIEEAPLGFHSRFSAESKVYRYSILNRSYPSAFLRNRVYFYPYPLNIAAMRQAAKCLSGRHDFSAFCASGSGAKNRIRTIKRITIRTMRHTLCALRYPLITIDIEADGFLYNMVRNIVGTLVEIGRGRLKKGDLRRILLSRNRKLAGPTAPARGLCLIRGRFRATDYSTIT